MTAGSDDPAVLEEPRRPSPCRSPPTTSSPRSSPTRKPWRAAWWPWSSHQVLVSRSPARQAHKGEAGPAGPQGPPGPQGPTGDGGDGGGFLNMIYGIYVAQLRWRQRRRPARPGDRQAEGIGRVEQHAADDPRLPRLENFDPVNKPREHRTTAASSRACTTRGRPTPRLAGRSVRRRSLQADRVQTELRADRVVAGTGAGAIYDVHFADLAISGSQGSRRRVRRRAHRPHVRLHVLRCHRRLHGACTGTATPSSWPPR